MSCPGWGPRASAASSSTSAHPSGSSRRAARNWRRCPGYLAKSRARFTNTFTRFDERALQRPAMSDGYKGRLEDFVVITGFSGAGKSQAMATFEDAGYFCVDNLPPEMIGSLADLFGHEGSKVEHAAVVCDARAADFPQGLLQVLNALAERGVPN